MVPAATACTNFPTLPLCCIAPTCTALLEQRLIHAAASARRRSPLWQARHLSARAAIARPISCCSPVWWQRLRSFSLSTLYVPPRRFLRGTSPQRSPAHRCLLKMVSTTAPHKLPGTASTRQLVRRYSVSPHKLSDLIMMSRPHITTQNSMLSHTTVPQRLIIQIQLVAATPTRAADFCAEPYRIAPCCR